VFVSLAVSPDGRYFVTGGYKTLRRGDMTSGDPTGQPMAGHEDMVWGISVGRDGRYVASGSFDGTLRFWDADSGQPLGEPLESHGDRIAKLVSSRDDRRVLSWGLSPDDAISVWLWPGPASWRDDLCGKLTSNMSRKQWSEWVSPDIDYITLCPDLPVRPDEAGN
jgi:WD40 repeat protein